MYNDEQVVRVTTGGHTSKDSSQNSTNCVDKLVSDLHIVETNACQRTEYSIWEEPSENRLTISLSSKPSNNS